jgi:hypothetical protein
MPGLDILINTDHLAEENELRPPPEPALFSRQQTRRSPIAKMECGVGQCCSPKQVILLFARWKLRGFLSDLPSKRCDAILKRFCLFGFGHPAPYFGARNSLWSQPVVSRDFIGSSAGSNTRA